MIVSNNESSGQNRWTCKYLPVKSERSYPDSEIYPDNICPWLYYSAYPYMLGLHYGANFKQNEFGDALVSCPAKDGCKVIISKRNIEDIPELFKDSRIDSKYSFAIFLEIRESGNCSRGYKQNQKFFFPTCMEKDFICPAAWYQSFLLTNPQKPSCISLEEIHCPDSEQNVTINLTK